MTVYFSDLIFPICDECKHLWCEHVVDSISRGVLITTPAEGVHQWRAVPIMRHPLYGRKDVPYVMVDLRGRHGGAVVEGIKGIVGVSEIASVGELTCHLELREIVFPYLVQWQVDNPCRCTPTAGALRAPLAAYRVTHLVANPTSEPNVCWRCDTSDLIPDVASSAATPITKGPYARSTKFRSASRTTGTGTTNNFNNVF